MTEAETEHSIARKNILQSQELRRAKLLLETTSEGDNLPKIEDVVWYLKSLLKVEQAKDPKSQIHTVIDQLTKELAEINGTSVQEEPSLFWQKSIHSASFSLETATEGIFEHTSGKTPLSPKDLSLRCSWASKSALEINMFSKAKQVVAEHKAHLLKNKNNKFYKT